MTHLEAGDLTKALRHAQTCLDMCRENKASNLDLFFAFEALAKVERARKNDEEFQTALDQATHYFEKLETSDKEWCEPSLKKLNAFPS